MVKGEKSDSLPFLHFSFLVSPFLKSLRGLCLLRFKLGILRGKWNQRAHHPIRQRQHNIQILERIQVVIMMMRVEPPENPSAFNPPILRNMHAPVQPLIEGVVCDHRRESAEKRRPTEKVQGSKQ